MVGALYLRLSKVKFQLEVLFTFQIKICIIIFQAIKATMEMAAETTITHLTIIIKVETKATAINKEANKVMGEYIKIITIC